MSEQIKGMRFLKRLIIIACLICNYCSEIKSVHAENKKPSAISDKIDFTSQIQPLIEKHCISCHDNEDAENDFSFTSSQNLLKGGLSGKVIVPGNAKTSPLFLMISHQHEDEIVMPPEDEGTPLNKQEIALFKRWINEGANWPEKIKLGKEDTQSHKKRNHWAFQPIKKPVLPSISNNKKINNDIDYFIIHKLDEQKLKLSPEADKRTLIRRVTLDLIGLPPTPAELEDFLRDQSPNAYTKLVDRLLKSPHYGERWARPWLDLCHYGDSDGYLTDAIRPVAWRYRDWLVDALNSNMPFDQFTIEQLAGDLIPESTVSQKIATGFLRQTLSNREGGADLEEFRVAKVIDRTKIVGTSWLGLTLECCRCHNHKYDPISQKEFYQFYSFFNNDFEINVDAPLLHQKKKHEKSYQTYLEEREKILGPIRDDLIKLQNVWEKKLLYAAEHPEKDHKWTRTWEVLGLVWGVKTGEGQMEGLEIIRTKPSQRSIRQSNDLTDYFLAHGPHGDDKIAKKINLSGKSGQIKELKKKHLISVRAPAIAKTKHPQKTHVHLRGIHTSKGIPVNSNTPAFLPKMNSSDKQDRLKLAKWLVSPNNPLTARVVINRMWQEFFGQGFVISSDDFGTQGDHPTHPELLDWLASRYIENDWNTKTMHKLIVTSATYKQSSIIQPDIFKIDPTNRWLSRQIPKRLSAEAVRDIALAASGLLSKKMGGEPVRPLQPESVVKEGFGLNTWVLSKGENRYRRGLYTLILRTSPFAQSVIFDSPSPGNICTKRERSNTPLQALTLLNDPAFYEAAEALAARITKQHPHNFKKQITFAYTICFSRNPTDEEFKNISILYQEQLLIPLEPIKPDTKTTEKAAKKSAPKVEKRETNKVLTKEEKATVIVCSVLLNLHEFITRQ